MLIYRYVRLLLHTNIILNTGMCRKRVTAKVIQQIKQKKYKQNKDWKLVWYNRQLNKTKSGMWRECNTAKEWWNGGSEELLTTIKY